MDIKELEETASLAHLKVNRAELEAALPAFEQMLGFFAAMNAADADPALAGAEKIASGQAAGAALVSSSHFRGDTASPGAPSAGASPTLREKMLSAAGDRDGAFIVIPNVL
jgi:aspartyl-tRNA(Asn)/glutamyl-tRNA(Gln) amidotransferase subunit C